MTEPRDRTLTPSDRTQRSPRPAGGWLTPAQERALRDGLRDLPELGALAVTTLPGEHLGGEGGARGVPGSRPPLNIAALDLLAVRASAVVVGDPIGEADLAYRIGSRKQALRDSLEAWCWLAHDEMLDDGEQPRAVDHPSVAEACAWLLRHIVWILDQQWVDELAIDVALMVRECRAILRERPTYRPRCRKCNDHVLLVDQRGREVSPEEFTYGSCSGCGETYPKGPAMDALGKLQEFTIAELSERMDVPVKTLHRWHKQGLLTPKGRGPAGRLFALDDAMNAKALMRGRSMLG